MDVAVFSSKPYDQQFLSEANHEHGHRLSFFESRLNARTVSLASGHQAVCCFVNDELNANVLEKLASMGIKSVAMRCAGFNNLDLDAARRLGIAAARVPAYSPHAVAEHAMALILTLNRKLHRAYNRVREMNFSLDGLLGFDLLGRTVGVVGTGKIGQVMVSIFNGFGCKVLAHDPYPVADLAATYVPLPELLERAKIVSLHCPLTSDTHHLINAEALSRMRQGALLINTSRGALVDTVAVIEHLKSGHLGGLGLDVYEEENELFFEDFSSQVIQDDVFARLLTFPNVVVTGHQAFFTQEALANIASTTLANLSAMAAGQPSGNEI
ncbi:MAG: 2-hydroxyacid dehydrogenase [Candidatus Eremiobacteraeota bacterium]|nr:2-hydroxyacid dehydrogenase [Candidatus Eremiobacteraeota bacterium]